MCCVCNCEGAHVIQLVMTFGVHGWRQWHKLTLVHGTGQKTESPTKFVGEMIAGIKAYFPVHTVSHSLIAHPLLPSPL